MKRADLVEAIEVGIHSAALSPYEIDALRTVAETTKCVARTRYRGSMLMGESVGCPVTQAGLIITGIHVPSHLENFAFAFDDATADYPDESHWLLMIED